MNAQVVGFFSLCYAPYDHARKEQQEAGRECLQHPCISAHAREGYGHFAVADPEVVQRVQLNPPSC